MNIKDKKIKKGFCFTQCRSDCKKQTKHVFLGNPKIDGLILACFVCVLTPEQKEYVNQINK